MQRADRYAVMGNPIAHSKSPMIHHLFAEQTGEAIEYGAILVEHGAFAAESDAFRDGGGRGLNVTVPFKQDAWVYVDQLGARAERAGAVNTVSFADDGESHGDNTDGIGLVRDLTVNHGATIAGRRVLLLGAGGAARGVLEPLLLERPGRLVVANRTGSKAEELALLFADLGPVAGCGLEALDGERFDLVIDATASALASEMPSLPDGLLAAGAWCYDLMYGGRPTPFLHWARTQGAERALDGLGMLVEQAAESFQIWRGLRPETAPVIEALRRG